MTKGKKRKPKALEKQESKKQHLEQKAEAQPMDEEKLDDAHLRCPITKQLFFEPVSVGCCEKTFEKEAVAKKTHCPCCNKIIKNHFTKNEALEKAVALHLEQHEAAYADLYVSKTTAYKLLYGKNYSLSKIMQYKSVANYPMIWKYLAESHLPDDDGISFLKDLLKQDPNNPYIYVIMANREIVGGNYDNAIKHCEAALLIFPQCTEAYGMKALAHAKKGENEKAEDAANTALFYDEKEQFAIIAKHYILLNKKSYEEILDSNDFETLAQNYDGQVLLAVTFYETEDVESSLKYAEKAFKLVKSEALLLIYRSMGISRSFGREAEGLENAEKALTLLGPQAPTLYLAYLAKGMSLINLGRPEEAIRAFNKAIQLRPDDPLLYANRAMGYSNLNQLTKALRDLDYAFRKDIKQKSLAYTLKGTIHWKQNKLPEALEALDLAIKSQDKYFSLAQAYFFRFLVKKLLNQYDDRMLNDLLFSKPHHEWKNKAVFFEQVIIVKERLNQDIGSTLREAINECENPDSFRLELGKILLRKSNYSESFDLLVNVSRSPTSTVDEKTEALVQLAELKIAKYGLDRADYFDSIISDCRTALELNPDLERPQEILQLIEGKKAEREYARKPCGEKVKLALEKVSLFKYCKKTEERLAPVSEQKYVPS